MVALEARCAAAISRCIRITEFRRIGRKARLLEIDTTDDRLHVFTRWDLGTDPLEVLDALTSAGYAGYRCPALARRLSSGDGDGLDHDGFGRPVVAVGRGGGDAVHDLLRLGVDDLPEDGVATVEVRGLAHGDEEL